MMIKLKQNKQKLEQSSSVGLKEIIVDVNAPFKGSTICSSERNWNYNPKCVVPLSGVHCSKVVSGFPDSCPSAEEQSRIQLTSVLFFPICLWSENERNLQTGQTGAGMQPHAATKWWFHIKNPNLWLSHRAKQTACSVCWRLFWQYITLTHKWQLRLTRQH